MRIEVLDLIPLILLIAIVAAIVSWRRREGLPRPEDVGIGTGRRLYFYLGTLAYAMVASTGVVLIASYVLDELFGPTVLDSDVTSLALGVVLALIWTPTWLWHRGRVQQLLVEEPAERTSVLRKFATYLTIASTAVLVTVASVELLSWLFGVGSFDGYPLAAVVVWGGLWALTWHAESREDQPTDETKTVRRVYVYVTSAYALAMLSAGSAIVLYVVLREAYDGLFDLPILLRGDKLWGDTMRSSAAVALVGGALWAGHWLYLSRDDAGSDVRQFYLYALAIPAGAVSTLSAAGVLLFGVLDWWIGTPAEDAADAYFRFVPGAAAPLLVGLLLWTYHWTVIQQERAAAGQLLPARRIYGYSLTALGLGTIAGAIVVLVPTVIAILITSAQEVLAGEDWWRDQMVLFLTFALLGVPVWGYHWRMVQQSADLHGADERQSFPRRMLVYGVLGVGALTVLGSVSYLLFLFLDATLEDKLSLTLLRDAKWAIGALAAAVLIAPYHWFVFLEDREAAAAEGPTTPALRRKIVTLLVPDGSPRIVQQVEATLGASVRVLHRTDPDAGLPDLSGEDLHGLERRINEASGERVLVVADASGVQVYSYR